MNCNIIGKHVYDMKTSLVPGVKPVFAEPTFAIMSRPPRLVVFSAHRSLWSRQIHLWVWSRETQVSLKIIYRLVILRMCMHTSKKIRIQVGKRLCIPLNISSIVTLLQHKTERFQKAKKFQAAVYFRILIV